MAAGSVVVNLIANTKSFQKGLRRSKLTMDNFRKTVIGQQKSIASVSKQITGRYVTALGVAAVGIGRIIHRNNELADSFAITGDIAVKYAQSIGVSIQSLQGLQYAAEQMGSSSESLNKSLTRMIANLGDAAKGTGEAKEAFAALNLNAQYLISMTPDKSFLAIADAIGKVKNRTEAAALAYEIFGRKGVELVNTLNLGSDGIRNFSNEAESLGAIMSDKVAENIAEAKGELDKYAAIQRGFEQAKASAGRFSSTKRLFKDAKAWWQTKGPTRKWYDSFDRQDQWKIDAKAADATKERAEAMARLAVKTAEAAAEQRRLNDATALKSQETGMKYFFDMLGDLKDQAAGVDDLTRALIKMDASVGFTAEQYKKMKDVIEQINVLRNQIEAEKESKNAKIKEPDTFSLTPEAREIDTSMISVTGLAMNGKPQNYERQMAASLQNIERHTRKTANQEMLN